MNEFIYQKGRSFYPMTIPPDVQRGKKGDCFDHCLIQAAKSGGKYRYCEGVALFKSRWIHHAWLTDRTGKVAIDPTWVALNENNEEVPLFMVHYVGAILVLDSVMEFVLRTGYKSPLANHAKDPELAQKIYETAY